MSMTNVLDTFGSLVIGLYAQALCASDEEKSKAMSTDSEPELLPDSILTNPDFDMYVYRLFKEAYYLGLGPAANGDDFTGRIRYPVTLSDIAEAYDTLGFIVHPLKGLKSYKATEFVAVLFNFEYKVKSH